MSLSSIQNLTQVMDDDAARDSRFPVRFILVDGIESWRQALELLKTRSDLVRLSAFCSGADTYPLVSLSDLVLTFREAKRDVTIVPIAELLRLREEKASEIVVSLATYESVGQQRIYIPLFQCSEPFHRAMSRSSRWRAGELSPVWKTGTVPENLTVTLSPTVLSVDRDSLHVDGFRGYLEAWEEGQVKDRGIYMKSKMAKSTKSVHGTVSLKVYANGYEALVSTLQGNICLESGWGTDAQWEWLAKEMQAVDDFNMLAGRILNVANYDFWQIARKWKHLNDAHRWLFVIWTRLENPGPYIGRVACDSTSPDEFAEGMATCVLDRACDLTEPVLYERQEALKALGIRELPQAFWQGFGRSQDPLRRLQVLTGLTNKERQETILAVAELLEHGSRVSDILPVLHRAYPAVAQYISPFEDHHLREYLEILNICRLMNKRTKELDDISEIVEKRNLIFQFDLRDRLLEQIRQEPVHEIWVDGLGVQWMPFIKAYIREHGSHVEAEIQIARCNLPSVTEFNKNWAPEAELIRALDQAGHSYDHKYPSSIVNEIIIVENALKSALERVQQGQRVLITADHGTMPYTFARGSAVSMPETAEAHKWGRCAKVPVINDEIAANTSWIEENKWLCLRGHNRFQTGSGTNPDCLVHGGASLEEALVPVVKIRMKSSAVTEEVTITIPRPETGIDANGNAILREIALSHDPGELSMRTRDNRVFLGTQRRRGVYDIAMTSVRPGTYHVVFETQNRIIGKATIRLIAGGLQERDLGI